MSHSTSPLDWVTFKLIVFYTGRETASPSSGSVWHVFSRILINALCRLGLTCSRWLWCTA
jgi:hypothetical protein